MSLLSIIQEAAGSLSLPVPTSVAGNTAASETLWLNLAKREGNELARRHDWQNLVVQKTWTSTATEAQTDSTGSDFDRPMPDPEIWNTTSNLKYLGPVSSIDWVRLHSGVSGGVIGWWRLLGNDVNIYPAPTAGQTLRWEYMSKNWCQSSGGAAQSTWAADDDTALIPERLISLGLTWRWLKSKGMDYAEDMATYEREIERATSRDRAIRIISVGKSRPDAYPPQPYWSGTIG